MKENDNASKHTKKRKYKEHQQIKTPCCPWGGVEDAHTKKNAIKTSEIKTKKKLIKKKTPAKQQQKKDAAVATILANNNAKGRNINGRWLAP